MFFKTFKVVLTHNLLSMIDFVKPLEETSLMMKGGAEVTGR